MAENYDITSALNKIKPVLNQYKAFKEIEEALKKAAQCERIVAELGFVAEGLKAEVALLEARRTRLIASAEEAEASRVAAVSDGEKELDALREMGAAERRNARKGLDRIAVAAEAAQADHADRIARAEGRLAELRAAADAEVDRLNAAKLALEQLKAAI